MDKDWGKKVALDAVMGVLGVFIVLRAAGGVVVPSLDSFFELNALIFAAVGVLSGRRFNGGNLRVCKFFLLDLRCGLALTSGSTDGSVGAGNGGGLADTCEEVLGARGVSIAFIASASVETTGLAEIAPSKGGRLEDRAEKNGWSCSLPGDSYALGIAGTGGTSSSKVVFPDVSNLGFGVGSREELTFCGSLTGLFVLLRTEL